LRPPNVPQFRKYATEHHLRFASCSEEADVNTAQQKLTALTEPPTGKSSLSKRTIRCFLALS
jgi:hypothetical protein